MAIQNWSDDILMGELAAEPAFSDDLEMLLESAKSNPRHVVLNFATVDYLNSSNIARLLKVRKTVMAGDRRLILCGINNQVWGIFLVTGLEKVFECTNDTATALATLQLGGKKRA
jgi:anti-anti-sigma factor